MLVSHVRPVLYTITAYLPSIGGAQLHLHEYARRIARARPVMAMYQWDETRTDWLRGTTLDAPSELAGTPLDNVNRYRIGPTPEERDALRFWVRFYRLFQGRAIDRISGVLLDHLRAHLPDPMPGIIHNSRVGREGLTVASLKLAQALDIPFVFTPNHHPRWKGWLYRHYLQVYRAADALIVYSDFEATELTRLGVSPSRIHRLGIGPILAPSGDGLAFRSRLRIPPDAPLILFLGQKYAYKRFSLILEAAPHVWARHPTTHFVFIGPRTPYSMSLFQSASKDARIHEMDTVDLQTKTDALTACDVLCVPSGQESFGGVYIEAGQLGKPVIGGDAPAIREVILEGETGYCVGPDSEKLAEQLNRLIADPDLRSALGRAGYIRAQEFQWTALAERLSAIYTSLG